MNAYTFKLYRRLRNPKQKGVIISAFDLTIECDDPFIERIRLAQEYKGWAIAATFTSATDEAYDEAFGEDAA